MTAETIQPPQSNVPVVIALLRCESCDGESYSGQIPRITRAAPPCPDCGGQQRLADLIVGE